MNCGNEFVDWLVKVKNVRDLLVALTHLRGSSKIPLIYSQQYPWWSTILAKNMNTDCTDFKTLPRISRENFIQKFRYLEIFVLSNRNTIVRKHQLKRNENISNATPTMQKDDKSLYFITILQHLYVE